MKQFVLITVSAAIAATVPVSTPRAQQAAEPSIRLTPTVHPRLPADPTQFWIVPDSSRSPRSAALAEFAAAVRLEVDDNYAKALPIFSSPALQKGPLGDYAVYYQGLAQLRLNRAAEGRRTFQALQSTHPTSYLLEAAALREAECDETLGDAGAALEIYERLSKTKTTAPDDVLMHIGKAAKATGNIDKASSAFARVYYEFPFSDLSAAAGAELEQLSNGQAFGAGTTRYKLEVGRAERLFGSKRYIQARPAFEMLRGVATGDDRELVDLRLAECDYFLKRARSARDGVRPYIDHASRQAEALYFYAVASRELGDRDEYFRTVRRIVSEFPTQSWAEEALNNLATHYIVDDDDDQADATFREMYEKFPSGRYAERAAWKIGWTAYRNGVYAETARVFERVAADFPRSDYRPAWLYWSGRAHDLLKEQDLAVTRYTLVATDYLNSYYGRLAVQRLDPPAQRRRLVEAETGAGDAQQEAPVAPLPPNQGVIRALLSIELYDQAVDELRYAQKVWGDSSAIQATLGWIAHERGDLRAGINAVKRAYPQYLAAGGEKLPDPLLKVLFPVNYWPIIRRYATERHLDPYMMAALIAQESTFTVDARSRANAYGLMQLVPSTGRRYARELHMKRFSISLLTNAETNIRMGTAYFADLVRQFGDTHFALAGYNAGESRVVRWVAERPGIGREEFIDDIPFPETQGYVRKILGTAEDYRRLYGPDSARGGDHAADASTASPPLAASSSAKKAQSAKSSTTKKKKSA